MAIDKNSKGWIAVPGLRPKGDRTLAEQMMGLERALKECRGKSVLDLGCAEGMIAREFARAGARRVLGIELLKSHLEVAHEVCRGLDMVEFRRAHLGEYVVANPQHERFDIVLALGIIHKLEDPNQPMGFAADCAKTLLCFRAPAKTGKAGEDYVVKSKFSNKVCNVPALMRARGFVDQGTVPGVRGEGVQYWERK